MVMKSFVSLFVIILLGITLFACGSNNDGAQNAQSGGEQPGSGQEAVKDDDSQKDIVKVAAGSPDHSTLVTALKAADLVRSLSNVGPFTVFAPTNAAFDKLPKGTVENLLKPENKNALADILHHHVQVAVLETTSFTDGQDLVMFDGKPTKLTQKDGAWYIDKAKIVASVRASNGIIHIVDEVILPPSK